MSILKLPPRTRAVGRLEERLENESESRCDRPLVGGVFRRGVVAVASVFCFPSEFLLGHSGASLLKEKGVADGPE